VGWRGASEVATRGGGATPASETRGWHCGAVRATSAWDGAVRATVARAMAVRGWREVQNGSSVGVGERPFYCARCRNGHRSLMEIA
jgi:hypothetical protein